MVNLICEKRNYKEVTMKEYQPAHPNGLRYDEAAVFLEDMSVSIFPASQPISSISV